MVEGELGDDGEVVREAVGGAHPDGPVTVTLEFGLFMDYAGVPLVMVVLAAAFTSLGRL